MDIAGIANIVEAVSALAVASGAVPVAVRYFQARGVDIVAIKNNSLVRAAGAAGLAALSRLQSNGANLHDPTVFAAAVESVELSMQGSHAETIAYLQASPADVSRVADQQTHAALLQLAQRTPPPAPVAPLVVFPHAA